MSEPKQGLLFAASSRSAAAPRRTKGKPLKRSARGRRSAPPREGKKRAPSPTTAEVMSHGQREISVSEFFAKNRHLLGFDNPSKALLTTIKELVDNSLDATDEARIPAEVEIRIDQLAEDRFRVTCTDNGPGIGA